jgi:predicted nucleic acid-binding protein
VKKILVDVDVVLDVLAIREPFFAPAANLWAEIEKKNMVAYLAAHSVTTIFYLIRKAGGRDFARQCIEDLLSVFEIAPVGKTTLALALRSDIKDFEDAVQSAVAREVNADHIVTRNTKHYKTSGIPAITPDLYLATLKLS